MPTATEAMVPKDQSPRAPIGRRQPPRNFFSRREQFRLMVMVASLLMVWLLMQEARRRENWVWLTGSEVAPVADVPGGRTDPHLPQAVSTDWDTEIDEDAPAHAPVPRTIPSEGNLPEDWDWSVIRDDLPFNAAETDTFLTVLDWWRRVDLRSLSGDTAPAVGYLQLVRQSDAYRGRLVRVSGTVRRAHRLTAHPNAQGISSYWRCWLFPDGSDSPIVVYSLEMPRSSVQGIGSFPQGMTIRESVQFQGVFFKRWAYRAQGGTMMAPLVIARSGDWQPATPPPPTELPSVAQAVLAVAVAALLAALAAVWVYRAGRTRG